LKGMHQNARFPMGITLNLYGKAIFTLVKDVGGRLAERVFHFESIRSRVLSASIENFYYILSDL
jgi:hypothetical protein